MAKNDDSKSIPAEVAGAGKQPAEFPLTLDEFCARLSQTDKRVELIAGFHASERAAGNLKDMENNFRKRFGEFMKRPVG